MISLVLAAVVTAGAARLPPTLAGVALGADVAQVLAQHPDAQKAADSTARWWTWSVDGGGTVIVTVDDAAKVNRIDFIADKGATNAIDLPCAGLVPVRDPPEYLERVLKPTPCSAYNGAAYGVPGPSIVEVRFRDLDAGPLVEATWYRATAQNPTPVGQVRAVIDYIRPLLKSVGGAARVDYAGECPTHTHPMNGILFPTVYLQMPQGPAGFDAVKQIFRDDPKVTVAQDRSGMLRIEIGSVPAPLLQVKLPSLNLNELAQYDARFALDAIESQTLPEANKHGISSGGVPFFIDRLIGGHVKGAPHLPALMRNITLDDALNAVARTFKGIVMYGQCTQPDGRELFHLNFIYVK